MTADAILSTTPAAAPGGKPRGRRLTLSRLLIIIALGLIGLSLVHLLTGADDVTSKGAIQAALESAVPIGLAGLGGLWAERAGVVNIGLEGQLILGTWFGAWGSINYGPWLGLLIGVLGGALGGLVHAIATVTFGVDHIVSGVALTILATGVARFLSFLAWEGKPGGGGSTQSPTVQHQLPRVSVPGLNSLDWLEKKHWFLISDLVGILRGLLVDVSVATILAVLLVPLTWYVLWRTSFGLRVRSVGEDPHAAETVGVNVYLYKYYAVLISGGVAGMGGAFLSTVASTIYREGATGGRGYIGLAAMIFGNWRPGGLLMGALTFGYTDSLRLRDTDAVHALLLLVALGLLVLAAIRVINRQLSGAIVVAVAGAVILAWFLLTDSVPREFTVMTPYVTTLFVLALGSQRLRMPAADGQQYRKGSAG